MWSDAWNEPQFTKTEIDRIRTKLVNFGLRSIDLEYTDRPPFEKLYSVRDMYVMGDRMHLIESKVISGSGFLKVGRTIQFWLRDPEDDDIFL